MDEAKSKKVINEVREAIKKIAEENGLEVVGANAKYNNLELNMPIKLRERSNTDELNRIWKNFVRNNDKLSEVKIGDIFTIDGRKYEFVDINTRCKQYPVVLKRNGKLFRVSTDSLMRSI